MANTRQDLITLVLENLGVLAAGQSASIEDRSTVDRRIGPKLAELAKREVITGLDADNLDDGVFLYVADVIAYACRTPFGITGAKEEMLTKAAGEAEAALNGMARQYDAGTATSTVFDPVQAALEHLGVIAGGQSASEKDRAVVHARVQPLLMSLRGRDICGATDPSMLSESLKGEFAKLLALECVLSFPVTPQRLALLQGWKDGAEASLKYQTFVYDVQRPMTVEPFWGRRRGSGWVA